VNRGFLLIAAGAASFATAVASAQLAPPVRDAGGYVGSPACQRCHEAEYESWRSTLHVQMTKPIGEARVLGDFKPGTTLRDGDRSYSMEARGGRYAISISRPGGPPEKFSIDYTLGARRFQGYLSKLPDGRIYVMPVFWHQETKRWLDYKEITPIPKDAAHDLRQIWNVTCVNCHATNLARNYNQAANTFATTWTEMGVGCEACHGPGRAHIDDPEHLNVFSMKKVAPRQIFDTCAYCHGNKNNVFFGFKAGDHYDDYAQPFLISQPIPANDPQGEFWPDGRASRFNRPQSLTVAGCFRNGEATCTSCHRMHGAENNHSLKVAIDAPGGGHSRESDRLCVQCHADYDMSADRHTHHALESQGSRCINCHMSDVNWRLLTRRLDHTFQPPVPEMTARFGAPNACTTCHDDRSPEWAAAKMDAWYGNAGARRRVVDVADVMYRAGSGDATVLPALAQLAVTRRQGALIRASAAEFAGQVIAKGGEAGGAGAAAIDTATVNALIGAAADSDPWVRVAAIRALGGIREPRAVAALAAHLGDASRVARVSAAEALMTLGIATLDGPAGEVLARAQDEWAESLRTFNDDSHDQATLGWLEASRGQTDAALRDLAAATKLDPANARPHVYLGVLHARASRFDEALQQFKAAKSLAPAYPNIDKLIDEVQKQKRR
jgi:predicted CXXCH cytochrome family protein